MTLEASLTTWCQKRSVSSDCGNLQNSLRRRSTAPGPESGMGPCGVDVLKVVSVGSSKTLQTLLESAPDYSRRITGNEPGPTDADNVLEAIPPGLDPQRKLGIGFWREDQLLGFADVLHGWPRSGVAHIGLLVVHGAHQGRGIGSRVHEGVIAQAVEWGDVVTLRIGIVETNAAVAEPFWRALGYQPTGEVVPYASGDVKSSTAIWERPLSP